MPERAGLRWWEGVASPGPAGYALAVLVSAPVLGVLVALQELVGPAVPLVSGGGETGTAPFLSTAAAFTVVGWLFSLVMAPPGVLAVHLLCARVRWQAVHVAAAGVAGLVAGALFVGDLDLGPDGRLAVLLGLATATGRACVVPLVPGVRRRRAQRTGRTAALTGEGVVDGYAAAHRRPGEDFTDAPGPG